MLNFFVPDTELTTRGPPDAAGRKVRTGNIISEKESIPCLARICASDEGEGVATHWPALACGQDGSKNGRAEQPAGA